MQVVRASGIPSAPTAEGWVVVIDVLRAFTTAAYALGAGAAEVRLVAEPSDAFAARGQDGTLLLAGEVGGRPVPGFDFGNSPACIDAVAGGGRLRSARLLLRSSAGVQCATAAVRAERILVASLAVASATARHILAASPPLVTLLASGAPPAVDGPEDHACADAIQAMLEGRAPDWEAAVAGIQASPAADQARDPAQWWISPDDLAIACRADAFSFAMPVAREGGSSPSGTGLVIRPAR